MTFSQSIQLLEKSRFSNNLKNGSKVLIFSKKQIQFQIRCGCFLLSWPNMRSIKDLRGLLTAIYRDSPQFTVKASFIWSYISLKELFKTKTVYKNRTSTFNSFKRNQTGSDRFKPVRINRVKQFEVQNTCPVHLLNKNLEIT